MSKKTLFYSFSITLFILGTFLNYQHKTVEAQTTFVCPSGSSLLSGYAWSSHIGWIHFSGANYGVCMNQTTGELSGYAWANPRDPSGNVNNIGWLSFNNSDLGGCGGGSCQATVNLFSGAVTGWAKFLASDGNGWDGGVHLSGPNYPSPQANGLGGVTLAAADANGIRNFNGFAWGSEVVGWISFRGSGYGVTVGQQSATCGPTGSTYTPPATVTWTATPIGSGPFTYSWSGDLGLTGNTQSLQWNYPTAGTYNASVLIRNTTTGQGGTCSSSVVVNSNPPEPPQPPTMYAPQASSNCIPSIALSWSIPPGADTYYVYRSRNLTGPYVHIGGTLTTNSYNDPSIAINTSYYYYVTARAGNSVESAPSNTVGPIVYTTPASCSTGGTVTLLAVPNRVPVGGRCNLRYTVGGGAATCTMTNPGGTDPAFPQQFTVPPEGVTSAIPTSPIQIRQNYTLDCLFGTTHVTASASCDVSPHIKEI